MSVPVVAAWLKGARANFLVLPVFLVMIGGAVSWYEGAFDAWLFLWTLAGVVLAHISVNLFNEYSDWKTGIDEHTERTPFSGGSGNLQAGIVKPWQVRVAAWATLMLAFAIGVGLTLAAGWPVLAFMVVGGLVTVGYTEMLTRIMLGEIMSGLTLGSLVVIGAYYVQRMTLTPSILWVSVPPGILTMLLLLLNEFPDADADRQGGRRHMVIVLGRKRAAMVYGGLLGFMYCWIVGGVLVSMLPQGALLGLLTVPASIVAGTRALRFAEDPKKIVGALGVNVVIVLATDLLLAVGYLVASV